MNRLITTVICGLVGIHTIMGAPQSRPKLVVGIMVDQLRTDYLENLQSLFGDKGFRKLMKDGAFLKDVDFKVRDLDATSGTAIIYTGNYPRYNGIMASQVYSPQSMISVPVLTDSKAMGNFTSETYSPVNLRLSTLADEIVIDGNGDSKVYAIGLDPQQAIIQAGHAGSSAFWINGETGNWATTTYYTDSPKILTQKNYSLPLVQKLDTLSWTPLLATTDYQRNTKQKKVAGFKNTFPKNDRNVYKMYLNSPLANSDVTDAAVSYLGALPLGGKDNVVDMLNLSYTAAPYAYGPNDTRRMALDDTYVRLDSELARLFNAIDKYVGLDNTLIYVASTGYFEDPSNENLNYRIPTGTFSVKRAISLLNSYLSAKYGNGSYIEGYSGGHIYLNHKTIEDKKLELSSIAKDSRDFIVRMSGVSEAYTMHDIMTSGVPSMEGIRLATDPKLGGDIVLEFNPGWEVTDDTKFPNETKIERSEVALTPVFIMGAEVAPEEISTTVDASAIAPTIARLLRIRSPNGVASAPLELKRK